MTAKLVGENEVLANLNKAIKGIENKTHIGLLKAVALIKRESQAQTPVDTGNLRASHYIAREEGSRKLIAEVGLTADYALPVHEGVEKNFVTGNAKFLERAISENRDRIISIIQRSIKL